jgi:hypothetical protein
MIGAVLLELFADLRGTALGALFGGDAVGGAGAGFGDCAV